MDEDMRLNHGIDNNVTTFGLEDQDSWVKSLEGVYHNVRFVLSWVLVGNGAFGLIANILVIMVFSKMGFPNTIDLSYTALAISDLCCVLAGMVYGIALTNWFRGYFNPMTSYRLSNMLGGLPQLTFSRITGLITAWISLERCFCVKFPTKVKLMITRNVTKCVLIAIFVLGCVPMALVYVAFRMSWQIDPVTNSTTLVLLPDESLGVSETVLFLFGVVYPLTSWIIVTICTIVLVLQLKKNQNWKKRNHQIPTAIWSSENHEAPNNPKHAVSTVEDRVTKVVVTVALFFLLYSVTQAASILANLIVSEYHLDGALRSLHLMNGVILMLVSQLNSSVNIFVFALSGQKFKSVLIGILSLTYCRK